MVFISHAASPCAMLNKGARTASHNGRIVNTLLLAIKLFTLFCGDMFCHFVGKCVCVTNIDLAYLCTWSVLKHFFHAKRPPIPLTRKNLQGQLSWQGQ